MFECIVSIIQHLLVGLEGYAPATVHTFSQVNSKLDSCLRFFVMRGLCAGSYHGIRCLIIIAWAEPLPTDIY